MRLLLFLLLMSSLLPLYAQEDTLNIDIPIEKAQPKVVTEKKESNKDSSSDTQDEFETPDSFDASEKLSEDIPAPFPVDI
jgi:hypothetical protein